MDNEDSMQDLLEQLEEDVVPEISFHAMTRTEHPQTMRVIGQLKNKKDQNIFIVKLQILKWTKIIYFMKFETTTYFTCHFNFGHLSF